MERIQDRCSPRLLAVGPIVLVLFLVSALSGVGGGSAVAATVNACPTTREGLVDAITAAGSGGTVMFNCATDTTVRISPDPVTPDPVIKPENPGSAPSSTEFTSYPTFKFNVPSTFSARVSDTSPEPTGTITFTQNDEPIPGCENAPINDFGASCTGTLTKVGKVVVGAVYNGDSHFASSGPRYGLGGSSDWIDDLMPVSSPDDAVTIGDDVTLDASQADGKVTLDGNDLSRILRVVAGAHLTVKHLALANGNAVPGPGGAISNQGGHLTVDDSTFTDNQAQNDGMVGDPWGGAVYSTASGVTELTDSDFHGNSAWDPYSRAPASMGGAVDNHGATTIIHGGSFTGNWAAWSDNPSDINRGRGGAVNLSGGTLTIDGAEFTGNEAWGPGAAVYGSDHEGGTLNVSNSRFSGNINPYTQYPDGYRDMGGLAVGDMNVPGSAQPALTVTGCTFADQPSTKAVALSSTGNATITSSSFSGFNTVGAVNVHKTATITDSQFSDNANPGGSGGAVQMRDGTVTGSTFTRNQAARGGALATIVNPSDSTSLTTVSGSRFIDNVASGQGSGSTPGGGGGIVATGSLNVVDSTFSGNSGQGNTSFGDRGGGGGAILSDGTVGDPLKLDIESTTFNGNSGIAGADGSRYGAAIYASETEATVTNSTLAGNEADHGGAIYSWNRFGNEGSVAIQASTIVGNTAAQGYQLEWGSLPSYESTPISSGSSIFAENDGPAYADAVFVDPFFASGGYNLFDDDGGHGLVGTDLTDTDPKLDPDLLADNGGPTETIALAADSPAIDAIPVSSDDCQATDQRGRPRPGTPSETACDIGAYESDWLNPGKVKLSVNRVGDGSGTVTADPRPVDGGYMAGSQVALTAVADEGSVFAGWLGGGCVPLVNPCVLTLDADITVTAEFGLVSTPGEGFDLAITDGVATFGDWTDVSAAAVDGKVASFSGDWDADTNAVSVPSESSVLPKFEGDFGSVSFTVGGTHLAGTWTANGKVTLQGPVRVDMELTGEDGDLSCHATTRIRLRSDQRALYDGARFTNGLDGAGALAAHWDEIPNLRGDAGCAEAGRDLTGPGGMLLTRSIDGE